MWTIHMSYILWFTKAMDGNIYFLLESVIVNEHQVDFKRSSVDVLKRHKAKEGAT